MTTRPVPRISHSALLGQILARKREELGLHQIKLAETLGISQPAYSRIEQGGTSITVAQLSLIANKLGIPPGRILDEVDVQIGYLQQQDVVVTADKDVPKAELLLALGLLAASLAIVGSAT